MKKLSDRKFIELLRMMAGQNEGGFGEVFREAACRLETAYGCGDNNALITQQAKELDRRDRIIKDQEAEIEHLKQVLRDNGVYSYMNRHGRAVWN